MVLSIAGRGGYAEAAKMLNEFPPPGLSRAQMIELQKWVKLRLTLPSTATVVKAVKRVRLPCF